MSQQCTCNQKTKILSTHVGRFQGVCWQPSPDLCHPCHLRWAVARAGSPTTYPFVTAACQFISFRKLLQFL